MTEMAGLPFTTVPNANAPPSGRQAPEELMNCRLSKCGSVAVFVNLRISGAYFVAIANNFSFLRREFCNELIGVALPVCG